MRNRNMKRLYMLGHPKGKKALKGAGVDCAFPTKKEAKELRDKCNEQGAQGGGFYVTVGPDHKDYKSKPLVKTHFGSKAGRRGDGFKGRK